jgi:hypothetical protein
MEVFFLISQNILRYLTKHKVCEERKKKDTITKNRPKKKTFKLSLVDQAQGVQGKKEERYNHQK